MHIRSLYSRLTGSLLLAATLSIAALSVVHAQKSVPVREANWQLHEKWLIDNVRPLINSSRVEPHWLPGGDMFWYRYKTSEGARYWLVDPERGDKRPLFDHAHLAEELSRLTGEEVDASNLPIRMIEFSDGNRVLRFGVKDGYFSYDSTNKTLTQVEPPLGPAVEPWENRSPDKRLCVFARGNNLFLREDQDSNTREIKLTTDGRTNLSWGYNWELVDDDDVEPRRVDAVWSPDSRKFYIVRADLSGVEDLWQIDYLSEPRPTLNTIKYPMPGEKIPRWELWVYDHGTGKFTQIDIDRWPDQSIADYFGEIIWWSDDSSTLYFARRSRDYLMVDLCAVNLSTGETRVLVEERQSGMVYIKPLVCLPGSNELIWWSHRSGWAHFYLYSADGSLSGQVTSGQFNAESVPRN